MRGLLAIAPSESLNTYVTLSVSIQWIVQIGIALLMTKIRTDKQDLTAIKRESSAAVARLEDKLDRHEREASAKQHELTAKLIDARMRDFTHDLANVITDLKAASLSHKEFVEETRGQMRGLAERDHADELKVLGKMELIQIEMAKHGATREEVDAKVNQLRQDFLRHNRP